MQTLRTRPALAIVIAILALLLLTGVAYAISRLTGYIPGIGLIDQSAPVRVLSGPVSQTRDGITLTVQNAVLTSDKTVIVFALGGVQWNMFPHDENISGCSGMAEVRLPDGTHLQLSEGGGGAGQSRLVYGPIPANINEVTLFLPCIQGTLPGKAPEDWEVPLRFVGAPPDMTVMPVIEIVPTDSVTPTAEGTLSITKVLDIGDNYILFGEFHPSESPANGQWNQTGAVKIIDGKGQDLFYTMPQDIMPPTPTSPSAEVWAYQISKNFTPPITIIYPGIYIRPVGQPKSFEFEFDAGSAPQPGQEWILNQPFTLDGLTIHLASISVDSQGGYGFTFDSPSPFSLFAENSNILSVEGVDIAGYTPVGGGGGPGHITQTYETLPAGKLSITFNIQHLSSGSKRDWKVQWSPENQLTNPSLYGLALKLDQYIPLDDGYYLIGHTEWTDVHIASAWPASWALKAYDAKGGEIPIEPADWQEAGLTAGPNQWLYKIYGKNFNLPVSLRAGQMDVQFLQPVKMTLDMRPYPFEFSDAQLGVPFKTGLIPLNIPGIQANAFKATYIKSGDLRGFEIAIQADPTLQALGLVVESGLDTSGLARIASAGGSNRDETTGLVLSSVLTNARMSFPLIFRADGATINGTWDTVWNPSTWDASATPVTAHQACVTQDVWRQVLAGSPPAIPAGLPEKALVSRGAISPEPSLFISALDGSAEQGLVFGNGSLSPDATKLVYNDADNHIFIMDISTGQHIQLTNGSSDSMPLWSPDGTKIAFLRQTEKGLNLFVMDGNGKNVRALTDTTDNHSLIGWMNDSQRLVFSTWGSQKNQIQTLDVGSGVVHLLITTSRPWNIGAAISLDGDWIAYVDKVPGRRMPGIFISHLDGTEERLLVQLEAWGVGELLWSPDGNWLAFSALDMNAMLPESVPALVNVRTCQVVLLPHLNGGIRGWVK